MMRNQQALFTYAGTFSPEHDELVLLATFYKDLKTKGKIFEDSKRITAFDFFFCFD